jgi:hypothetical protein
MLACRCIILRKCQKSGFFSTYFFSHRSGRRGDSERRSRFSDISCTSSAGKIKRRSRWTGPPAQKPANYAKAAGRIADVATIGLNHRAVGAALDGTCAGCLKNLTFCRNTSFWLARLLSRSNVRRGALEARGKKHCGVFCGNLNIDQPPVAGFVGRVNGPQEQVR